MKPLEFPLLADENLASDVVLGLRGRGREVRTVDEERLVGRPDREILQRALSHHRVVVTTNVKKVLLTPMPSASTVTAASVSPRSARSRRATNRTSCAIVSTHGRPR